MKYLTVLLAICAAGASAREWWENANFYQIYPRSFRDSDGDGIGDLNGVTERLQYLKDIGITAAWLSPIFKSPMVDFGYDVSDFYAIHPEYGTMADFKRLIEHAKKVGVRIVLDFVPNHTSDQCEWFAKSVNREPGYEDFYVWHNGTVDANGDRQPPSNWINAFRYSAWEWNDVREQYYLHQFTVQQPDLNFRNPLVIAKLNEVLRYWLDMGISGFRIDALPFMYEAGPDADGNFADEPVINDVSVCPDPNDWCHLNHTYTQNQPESIEIVYVWRALVEQYRKEHGGESLVLLTEAYTTFDNLMLYYGDGIRNGSMVPFNFYLMRALKRDTSAADMVANIERWMQQMPDGVQANWVLGNHDNSRIASRLGVGRADLFNILLQTLPGNAITYYGEEIGMTDGRVTWEQTVDPAGCNANASTFEQYSRDPVRTPFQWDGSAHAGFSAGERTWLPVAEGYRTNNMVRQRRAPVSHLQIYKQLLKLRRTPSMRDGEFSIKAIADNVVIYSRQTEGSDLYVIVLNMSNSTQTLDITEHFDLGSQAEILVASVQSSYSSGQIIDPTMFKAEAEVGVVLANV